MEIGLHCIKVGYSNKSRLQQQFLCNKIRCYTIEFYCEFRKAKHGPDLNSIRTITENMAGKSV